MHESLNPLVTSERAVASARRLTLFLYERELRERVRRFVETRHG